MEFNVLVISRSMVEYIGSAIEGCREVLSTQVTITSPFFIRRLLGVLAPDNVAPLRVKQTAPYSLPRTPDKGQTTTTTSIEKKTRERAGINMTLLKRYDAPIFLPVLLLLIDRVQSLRTFYESLSDSNKLSKDQLGVALIHLTRSIDFKASLGLDADT
ncbi:hypothetical protein Cgig2_016660 [Carnegiea gigantea]|uniref:Uncharacterized protein n=1 Tax=Carnegiea gigantea TaxID=171969 RepID=A0A9Q1L049_9CARY|nr:hypothetical protein Cgig2_016660 [Carnegiea gigantea]